MGIFARLSGRMQDFYIVSDRRSVATPFTKIKPSSVYPMKGKNQLPIKKKMRPKAKRQF